MEKFEQFEIENQEMIFGGKYHCTYVGRYGDLYADVAKTYVLFEEWT